MKPSQPRPPINIAASTRKVDVDNRFPISKYYRTADNLLKQANIYREEKNIVDLYILLLRFSSLVGETIPEHNDYPTSSPQEKVEYRKKLGQVITELEKLKPEAQKEIKRLNSIALSPQNNDKAVKNQFEWPNNSGTQVATAVTSNGMGHAYHVEERTHNLSISLPAPKVETLSRHSFLGQTGLRPRWDAPVLQTRVQYPTYIDASPIEIPKFTEDRKGNSLAEALTSSNDFDLELFKRGIGDVNVPPQAALIRQPSPPPVSALVQNISSSPHCTEHDGQIPPWKVADPFPGAPTTVNGLKQRADGPKQLYISANMMNEFLRLANANTNRNLETCGVLAGALKNSSFYVTALIIPKQQSTSDSCQTLNEEEIFDWQDKRNLFQLGWIHTHPKQTCFMSSIDLHTHYSYQVMLPEAIAIVMAPTDTARTHGIFRLSDPEGIKLIQNCQQRGFHPHEQPEDGSPIYEHCGHVMMSSRLKYDVVDLR